MFYFYFFFYYKLQSRATTLLTGCSDCYVVPRRLLDFRETAHLSGREVKTLFSRNPRAASSSPTRGNCWRLRSATRSSFKEYSTSIELTASFKMHNLENTTKYVILSWYKMDQSLKILRESVVDNHASMLQKPSKFISDSVATFCLLGSWSCSWSHWKKTYFVHSGLCSFLIVYVITDSPWDFRSWGKCSSPAAASC